MDTVVRHKLNKTTCICKDYRVAKTRRTNGTQEQVVAVQTAKGRIAVATYRVALSLSTARVGIPYTLYNRQGDVLSPQ